MRGYALGVLAGTLHRMDEIEDSRPDIRCNVCETNAHAWTEGILISFRQTQATTPLAKSHSVGDSGSENSIASLVPTVSGV